MREGGIGPATPIPARHPDGAPSASGAPSGRHGIVRQFELTEKVLAYNPRADIARIDAAYVLAMQAHGKQRRENGDPYISHPLAVAGILAGYRLDTDSIITALLHDVIEDTEVRLGEIVQRFGAEVGGLVDGVTKLTRLELQSDRTKQAENFRKLVLAMSKDIRVLLVKLADRLHNMRTLHFVAERDRRLRIARETMDIYAPLAERIGMEDVKTELQALAFAQLDPEAYETIQARLNFLRGQGADVIEEVGVELRRVCESAGIDVIEVNGREKSPFSIWEKMQRRSITFEQLSDIMAFRIIVPTREDCYTALGAVHAAYPVIAGRFKDYISTPKSNGYRSLHTGVTLRAPRNQKIEVQIRTKEMHEIAQKGVAAHWFYKEAGESVPAGSETARLRWVQDLLEILDNSAAPDEFLENTKLELYQDQVFCFTPKGQLIQLPRGATPVDFAYAVHSHIGDTCVGAKANGRLVPLRYQLQNGDQVEIMTARGGTPSPQWERFVVTGKARARIRRFIHQQERQQTRDEGRSILAKAFRRDGLDGSERMLESALKTLKCTNLEELYVGVGSGILGPKDVVHAVYPELRPPERAPRPLAGLQGRTERTSAPKDKAPLTGLVTGMAVHYAGCCHPVPGDRIVGIVATGKGVTIHVSDCPMLESFAATPERFIDVDWDVAASARDAAPYVGRLNVIAANEPRAMASLANAIAKQDGGVAELRVTNRQQDFCEVLVDVEVRDLRHLTSVIAGLRAATGIAQVDRARG